MSKIIISSLSLFISLFLASCGGDEEASSIDPALDVAENEVNNEEIPEVEEVAKKVQKTLVDKRFYIESSLKVFQSIYDRSSQKVVVVLVSENAPLKNFIEKMKTLVQ